MVSSTFFRSSPIRTLPSALESHQVSHSAYTMGRGLVDLKIASPPVGIFTLPRRTGYSVVQVKTSTGYFKIQKRTCILFREAEKKSMDSPTCHHEKIRWGSPYFYLFRLRQVSVFPVVKLLFDRAKQRIIRQQT